MKESFVNCLRLSVAKSLCLFAIFLSGCGSGDLNLDAELKPIPLSAQPDTTIVNTLGTPQEFQIKSANVARSYVVYAPKGLPTSGIPLVFMLHGASGSSSDVMFSTTESKWNQIADRDKAIIVYPQGLDVNGRSAWNDCRSDKTITTTAQDVTFISDVIVAISGRYAIDKTRVYVSGHSNGGMMALRLAVELPSKIAAVHSNAGLMAAKSQCADATAPVGVLISMGTQDPIVPFLGGTVSADNQSEVSAGGTVLSAVDSVNFWRRVNGITSAPSISLLANPITTDLSTIESSFSPASAKGSGVLYLKIDGAGHAWPSSTQLTSANQATLGKKNQDIDMSEEAWKFFKLHRLTN
jgi:polyhydroxybutyrate depolymerase